MRFTPSGAGYCRHCNRCFGRLDGRNFNSGFFTEGGDFHLTAVLVYYTRLRCPKCFTLNIFVPDDEENGLTTAAQT